MCLVQFELFHVYKRYRCRDALFLLVYYAADNQLSRKGQGLSACCFNFRKAAHTFLVIPRIHSSNM